jgi:hypothetical protein
MVLYHKTEKEERGLLMGDYGGVSPSGARAASGGLLSPCVANPDECYGGVAAEIGVKNMPPACFLNVSTSVTGSE